MTDGSGDLVESTEYMPYGGEREQSDPVVSNYKFTDQELDPETGLYNYNARLYDPVIGRFISADPIDPQPFNPQSLNRYTYCLNNPLIYVDPSGHEGGKFQKAIEAFQKLIEEANKRALRDQMNWHAYQQVMAYTHGQPGWLQILFRNPTSYYIIYDPQNSSRNPDTWKTVSALVYPEVPATLRPK